MTRLRRIERLQGTGAFTELSWDAKPARRFNLVYGWNASGKTTISRVLRFIEIGEIDLPGFESLKFRLQTDSGTVSEVDTNEVTCRVFNEDYIDDNLHFGTSSAEPIIILGKNEVEREDEIDELEAKQAAQHEEREKLIGRLEEIPDLESILTDCGTAVVDEFAGTPLASTRYDGRRYNKRNVKVLLENGDVSESNVEELIAKDESALATLREQVRQEQSIVNLKDLDLGEVDELFTAGNGLLQLSLKSETIERLEGDSQLRQWVQTGHQLHQEREHSTCQFCGNDIPADVLDRYAGYFTEEVAAANRELDRVLREMKKIAGKLNYELLDSGDLFSDLQRPFSIVRERHLSSRHELRNQLEELMRRLEKRQGCLQVEDSQQKPVDYPTRVLEQIESSMNQIWQIYQEHNERISQMEDEAKATAQELELHQVASTLTDQRFFDFKNRKSFLEDKLDQHLRAIAEYEEAIQERRADLRNTALAVEDLNSVLASFLGEGEIELEVESSGESELPGYRLTSRGEPVRYLSDGEKSVVALAYFLVSLNEEECNLEETIVVLDDPVDSQDAVFLYRTFGLLKRRLYNAGQVILLTHNYQLFNMVRDWLTSDPFYDESRLFHIKLERGSEKRVIIGRLPDLLKDFKTEYQYLVYRLNTFRSAPSLSEAPIIPNIARRVLENFASFKWSCRTSQSLNGIVQSQFIAKEGPHLTEIGEAVVKFLHEYSHGHEFDRPVTASVLEARDMAHNVLEFIYWSDKDHYQAVMRRIEALE